MQKINVQDKLVAVAYNGRILVDNARFEKMDTASRGEAVASFMQVGGNIEFRPDLAFLTNFKAIKEKIVKGEDVSLELAFNGVSLPDTFHAAQAAYHAALTPVIAVLDALTPAYPFVDKPRTHRADVTYADTSITSGGYMVYTEDLKEVWERASKFWFALASEPSKRGPRQIYKRFRGNGSYHYGVGKTAVNIGCQTITRYDLEQAALHYGWAIPKEV